MGAEAEKVEQPEKGAPDSKPGTITLDGLAQEVRQINSGLGSFAKALGTVLDERLPVPEAKSKPAAKKAAPTTTPLGGLDPDDLATRLLTEPEAVLAEKFTGYAKEQLAPAIQTIVDGRHDEIVAAITREFDDRYGEGTFKELVEPDFSRAVEALGKSGGYAARASRPTLMTVVNSIAGSKIDALIERKSAVQKKREENPPELLSGGRPPRAGGNTPSPEDRQWWSEYEERTGESVDLKHLGEIRKAKNPEGGWTIDSFPKKKAS